MTETWKGVFAAIPTPFAEGDVAYDGLKRNLSMWSTTPLTGYVVLGSTGEFVHLDPDEKTRVVRTVATETDDKRVIAGASAQTHWQTLEQIHEAAAAGAEACLVLPPHYYRPEMDGDAIGEFFERVIDDSPVPIILYNMPAYTGVTIPVDVVTWLSEREGVIGIKDSSGDLTYLGQIAAKRSDLLGEFQLWTGQASTLLPALSMGASGGMLALASVLPWECCEVYDDVKNGEWEKARQLQHRLLTVENGVIGQYGISGLKKVMELQGFYGGLTRVPLPVADSEMETNLRFVLREADLIGC